MKDLSIVVPAKDEADSIPELIQWIDRVMRAHSLTYEVILIDDGSSDKTWETIRSEASSNPSVRGIRFNRNFGKSAALQTGFNEAIGEVVVTMDADLQDSPDEIPELRKVLLTKGYDLVSGWKRKRHDPLSKTIPSKFFNMVTRKISKIELHDFNCGLKAYRREVVKTLQVYGEMHRYLPALAHWEGFRVTEMPVLHHPRKFGYSKFGFSRFFKGFLDLLTVMFTTRYVKRPLHLFGTIGSIMVLAGLITNIYLTVEWAMGLTFLSQRPLALFGIAMIIVGVQLISTGLIGELVVKNSLEKTTYSVRETLD